MAGRRAGPTAGRGTNPSGSAAPDPRANGAAERPKRRALACRPAEPGCRGKDITSIAGHKTLKEVARPIEAAERTKTLASRKGLKFTGYFNAVRLLTKHSRARMANFIRFHLLTLLRVFVPRHALHLPCGRRSRAVQRDARRRLRTLHRAPSAPSPRRPPPWPLAPAR